ncbi:MAG TPA: hypothetical protein VMV79_05830 [Alphaproteobacteria bacterium]|nr:hypothetical protein [Alphaproteobacteria bacterium]
MKKTESMAMVNLRNGVYGLEMAFEPGVMPGLGPGIHVLKNMDGRAEPGHDDHSDDRKSP